MVERFKVISISLFKCACCPAYLVFYAICVVCSDCGLVNYVLSHAFFLERACFLVPTSAWVYDLALWLTFSNCVCVLCLEIIYIFSINFQVTITFLAI